MLWQKFWRLEIISNEFYVEFNKKKVKCRCNCWKEKLVELQYLKKWLTKSCWCYRDEEMWNRFRKHWLCWTPLHKIRCWMRQRCLDPKSIRYKNYGWRWITILWKDLEEFYEDMHDTYREWLKIERRNNNWNYCRENCYWATDLEQANNKSTNRLMLYNWEIKTMSQWARIVWISVWTIHARLKYWWNEADAISKPLRYIKKL